MSHINGRLFNLLAIALLNAGAYHFAYVVYLHNVFGYADYRLEPASLGYLLWTYIVASLPITASRKSSSPSAVGAALIYAIAYVPIQLTLTFISAEKSLDLVFAQAALALSMVVLFRAPSPRRFLPTEATSDFSASIRNGVIDRSVCFLTGLGVVLIFAQYHSVMRLVSFADVYELRGEAFEKTAPALVNYLSMWTSYCLAPFYIARGIYFKRKLDWVVGIVILFVAYLAFGAKIAILTPLFMLCLQYVDNGRVEFTFRLVAVVALSVALIAAVIPPDTEYGLISSVVLLRIFGSNGWLGAVYYEYFSGHAHTFYTHIGPVNALVDGYPYGTSSLGQIIAQYYFPGSDEGSNFNAGFWASDGFAAMGAAGVLFITPFVAVFMRVLDRVSIHYPPRFVNIWMLSFWMGLLNAPFTVAFLSGGGGLILVLIMLPSLLHSRQASRK